ncbi:pyruvate dehydrogenase phosphatase regulatory subunit, mitochondrial-like isoform X1 [Penaeus chinensis]|uniref:pyruvate dehydrogenase phosphatase regulatory subunit, mitochondrial-like isoform X1 n=1 Tax=Penaeus chinensis TaxID=139456 RepID=UPI001FB782E9|nr:pyruvate dehydrogenase phosphatase regulatory subunit, mitochondrial-like isoform X1 [Penaeus chinensis]XP_047474687.1 pyruvate dehydrogenase phosphatase regulatory subunit, mitochondrial-like isoform X1 [Penaeus chinensis]XP_047474688.1 pyruvate dehydrogenase phosphatase regulatory subunit, mitochondrial-like isoform X1 [Penaeus chinensis]XP_047474689.1 pyruvate dehydrogenase phosphatase regulatory subunit, mitochondrial-like isoform X1 [Penaeus chinensis]
MLCQFSKIGAATRGRVLENGVPYCLSVGSGYNRKAVSNKPSLYRGLPSDVRFASSLPTQAQVVICGAGVVGNSIAYHLTREGWTDVVVLDQNEIGSGTSHSGSGVLGLFKPSSERQIVTYSVNLIKTLQEQGHNLGFKQCGSLNLAQTRDRAVALKRRLAYTKPSGLECEWLDRHEIKRLHPHLYTGDLEGGVWVADDAVANPSAVCSTLAMLAQMQGAFYMEGCSVLRVITDEIPHSQIVPKVTQIVTSHGNIHCEYFVNASGMWARNLGEKSSPKVRVPAFPAEHFYLHTEKVMEALDALPVVRDYDSHTFCLTRNQEFVVGGFEKDAKPAFGSGIPSNWRETLEGDDEHFRTIREAAEHRLPVLKESQYKPLINAPDNFTPDGKWILGETPEIDNYFVAVGMNGNSLQGAGGAGQAIAEWIMYGSLSKEMLPFDVRRFVDLHNNRRYLKERTREVVGRHYDILYPGQCEYKYARKLRCSPINSEQEARGAVFGTRMGFERPLYFDITHKRGDPPAQMPEGTFGKPSFIDCVREEYHACREGVGVIDLSSFTKIEITSVGFDKYRQFDAEETKSAADSLYRSKSAGNQVVEYMQKLSCNDVNMPVGGVIHTGMLNERGGYENDCLLIRRADNRYLMLAPTTQQTRIMDWMRRQITAEACVSVSDITSMYTVLCVVGPKSKEMLSLMCNTDLNFYGHMAKEINIAYASGVIVLSFTQVGEPGYTLLIPSEYTLHIYSQLMKIGHDYGIRNVGMMTMRALRVEKFIPFWAEELDSTVTPYEAGRGYKVKLNKEYFIGKFALMRQANQGISKRLVHFTLEDTFDPDEDTWPWGGEPIYRNNIYVGNTTSTAFGFTLNKMVCLGWVKHTDGRVMSPDYILGNSRFEIDIGGRRVAAKASLQPPKMPVVKKDGFASYRPKSRGIVA